MVLRSSRVSHVAIPQLHPAFLHRDLVKILRIAVALLLAPSPSILLAQKPVPAKAPAPPVSTEPLVVDVHPAPYRGSINVSFNIGNPLRW